MRPVGYRAHIFCPPPSRADEQMWPYAPSNETLYKTRREPPQRFDFLRHRRNVALVARLGSAQAEYTHYSNLT